MNTQTNQTCVCLNSFMDNYKRFTKAHPTADGKSWLYANYEKVREWAKDEPTEFLETLT